MKTILFAVLNIISLLTAVISLEFAQGDSNVLILVIAIMLFIISGGFSVFRKSIWHYAHTSKMQSKAFLLDSYKTSAALITSFIVLMSIVSDFVTVNRNFVMFISYVTVYLALTIPCHLLIFKRQYQKQELV